MKFKRSITTLGMLFTSLGCMIGSGWLFGAYYAAQIAGPAAIVSWLLGGILIIFIALTFSELSAALPLAGGVARFPQFSHGNLVSFAMSWLAWLSCVAVAPTETQAILQYSATYFPRLMHVVNGASVLTLTGFGWAAIMLLIMSALNIMGVKLLARYNNFITWWKIIIPVLTIVVIACSKFHVSNFTNYHGFAPYGWHGILWALPTAGIVFSFLGFREATSMAGEAKKPAIAIPVAVIGSVLICTLLYIAIQIIFTGSLSPKMLTHGWNHLSFKGDFGPFAGIAAALGLSWLVLVIYVDAVISPFGSGFIYTATTSRLNYAMAKNGYVPQAMLQLSNSGVPVKAILLNFVVGMFLFVPLPGWQALVGFQSSAIVLAYGVGPISLLVLRKTAPNLKRPFCLPYSKTICFMTFYICNLISYWTGWQTMWHLMVGVAIGLVFLFGYSVITKQHKITITDYRAGVWLLPYFIGLLLITYLGNFGGGIGIIPFGWDFIALAILSGLTMLFAIKVSLPEREVINQLPLQHEFNL